MTATTRRAGAYRNVMIVVECREGAWAAVDLGLKLAQRHGATATLALAIPSMAKVVVSMPEAPFVGDDVAASEVARYGAQLLDRARDQAQRLDLHSRAVAISAPDVVGEIARCARQENADVIVVACEPVNAVVRLFNGSLVPGLISAATVPVVICRDNAKTAPPRRRRTRPRHKRQHVEAGS
jgi:nucleotide-binding universal stress UspA family protein